MMEGKGRRKWTCQVFTDENSTKIWMVSVVTITVLFFFFKVVKITSKNHSQYYFIITLMTAECTVISPISFLIWEICVFFLLLSLLLRIFLIYSIKKKKAFSSAITFSTVLLSSFSLISAIVFFVFLFLLVLGLFCSLFFQFPKAETQVSDLGSFKIFHVCFAINFSFSIALAIYNKLYNKLHFCFILFQIF